MNVNKYIEYDFILTQDVHATITEKYLNNNYNNVFRRLSVMIRHIIRRSMKTQIVSISDYPTVSCKILYIYSFY